MLTKIISINSPQLLMLSGVGPEKDLKDKGINVVKRELVKIYK